MGIPRGFAAALFAFGLSSLAGAGCSGSASLESIYAGRTHVYEPGVPNFDLAAWATLRDGQPGVDCYLGIPYASLFFVPRQETYQARFETVFRLLDGKGKRLVAEYAEIDTAWAADYEATQVFAPYLKQKRLAAAPGAYVLEVALTDLQSQQQARRRQRVEVVAAGTARPVLSGIRVEGRRAGQPFAPVLSLHVPAGLDSLRTIVELYNARRLGELALTMRLLRFPADTAAARPPDLYTVSPFFGLVRYHEADTLQVTRRRLRDLDQEVVIEFDLPGLEQGIYRVEVFAEAAGDEDTAVLRRQRDFAVRSADFPKIATLDEMVEALTYIAYARELEHLRAADTPEEKKRRFDAFWGALVANRNLAANLLKHYYARVEEANLLYTTYKEGWKTDRGMVYVMLGSPLYVDRLIDREVWHYSYDDRDALRLFVFERRQVYQSDGLFEAYKLQREMLYEPEWRRAFERWRRGEML